MTDDLDRRIDDVLRMYLAKLPPNAPLPSDTPLVDLGLDSLNAMNLVLDLEGTFGVEFQDEMLTETTFLTAASLRGVLHQLLGQRASA
jgi:acyl carrier protein